ncbi:MAG: hypothetical protein ABI670_13765 [Chloroflexota bacterium]
MVDEPTVGDGMVDNVEPTIWKVPERPSRATVPLWSVFVPVVVALAIIMAAMQRPDERLHLWVLDVGEGNALLVRTPAGHTILVDGGPGVTPLAEGIGSRLPAWQHSIDVVVLTAPQQENMMGLVDLMSRYKVGQVVQTTFTPTTTLQQVWSRTVQAQQVPVHYARRGDLIGFEGEPEVIIKVLYAGNGTSSRGAGMVLSIEYGSTNILLAADIGPQAEDAVVRDEGDALASDVLIVANHGSATTSKANFLEKVRPEVSIISVGAGNRFGYPNIDTLGRLQATGSQVYRTDLMGTVEIVAEKSRFWMAER